ncbi:PREDICTED: uncharacterized protein LOC109211491 [Nicotiana attenuata]|uniref:uncharacterized protein LOC109211491 n=1 Tax=Nicotiana attenuata TaxID=49451 RepID=UPI0009047037|nr:PREDICTED: uncharacterized protein LOC109211491 [Nicotiana attenuata]
MAREIRKLTLSKVQSQSSSVCNFCGIGHLTHECQASTTDEVVNAVGRFDRGNYQSGNNLNPIGQRHPGFSWSSPGGSANAWQRNNSRPQGLGAPGFLNSRGSNTNLHGLISPAWLETHGISIRNLERQVKQLANILSERVPGTLPAYTERNKKIIINAVSLRSGHVLKDPIEKQKDELIEEHVEIVEEQKNSNNQEGEVRVYPDDGLKKKGMTRALKKKKDRNSMNDEMKRVHVNLPITKVISQMLAYAEFLKEILSNKHKVEETSVVKLTEHCSAILQNKLPQKCDDLGSFTILCSLESTKFEKSLYDSSASINLMPLSIFRKSEGDIGEIRSIPVSLQLVDQTTIIPEGIVEDVLVRVDKFVFPVDFIMVNMEENKEVPLILGRPFLATSRAIVDIQESQLMLRVGEERVVFKMNDAIGAPRDKLTAQSPSRESKPDKRGVYPTKAEKNFQHGYVHWVERAMWIPTSIQTQTR